MITNEYIKCKKNKFIYTLFLALTYTIFSAIVISTNKTSNGGNNMYKAEYADEQFEIIYAYNDNEAMKEAENYENEHGIVFNLFEIDENYENIRMIY